MSAPASLAAWREAGEHLRWREHRIFVRAGGALGAPGLLLIHGFPTASHDWHRVWDRLTERFRVIAPDLLGFGFSAKPVDFAYTIAAQADLVEAVLSAHGAERVTVLAHDYGDTVAQELLARQCDGTLGFSIEGACFLNGGLIPEAHRPLFAQRLLAGRLGPLIAPRLPDAFVGRSLRRICSPRLPDEDLDACVAMLRHAEGRRVVPALLGYMAERRRFRDRWVGALQTADVPLRLVDGVTDPISGEHLVAAYEAQVPNADTVRLPGVGHYPQLEAPEAVLGAFEEWVHARGLMSPVAADG